MNGVEAPPSEGEDLEVQMEMIVHHVVAEASKEPSAVRFAAISARHAKRLPRKKLTETPRLGVSPQRFPLQASRCLPRIPRTAETDLHVHPKTLETKALS